MGDASQAQTAAGLLTGGQAVGSFIALRRQASAIDTVSDFDTKLANIQAADAIRRGDSAAKLTEAESRVTVGRSRASLAAQGISVGSGSAVDVQVQNATFGELNAQMIRNNAAREAWGITAEATLKSLGQESDALRSRSVDTLVTGAARTYGLFPRSKRSKSSDSTPSGVPYQDTDTSSRAG